MFNSYDDNTLVLAPELCNGCRMCIHVCPHGVFEPSGKIVKISHPSACMECGACQLNCATRALTVESGVGCATAMFMAALRGKDMDECSCGPATVEGSSCC